MDERKNVTVVGGGNIGTQFAVHCAEYGEKVCVYCSKPDLFDNKVFIVNESGAIQHSGEIELITSNDRLAFQDADIIFITYPAFCMEKIANKIEPYAHKGLIICLVPGSGGGECAFHKCIDAGATVCGLQRVPSVARLVEYGKVVKTVGYRDTLHLASIPREKCNYIAQIVGKYFDCKCISLPNYLNITLTPSNPILHTTRLFNLFKDYKSGKTFSHNTLFYEDWNDETSELLLSCDEEVQSICHKLDLFDLSYVKSLRTHYESETKQQLTSKISNIAGFKGLYSPMKETEKGYIPDFNSRYFTADFPYGLSILIQLANFTNVKAEKMNILMNWYRNMCPNGREFCFEDYGINDIKSLIEYYDR